MHDIWNPWHGCKKISPGCANCYMYTLDKQRGKMVRIFTGQKILPIPCKKTVMAAIK